MPSAERTLSAAAQLLTAKGRLTEMDFRFLEVLQRRLGLPPEAVRKSLSGRHIGLPLDVDARRRLMRAVLEAAAHDGVVSPEESDFLRSLAKRMGVRPADLDAATKRALRWAGPLRPDESALDRVRALTAEIRAGRNEDAEEYRRRLLSAIDLRGNPAASLQKRIHDAEEQEAYWQRELDRIRLRQREVTSARGEALSKQWAALDELEDLQQRGGMKGLIATVAPDSQPEFREAQKAHSLRRTAQSDRRALVREQERCRKALEKLWESIRGFCDELAARI